MAKKKTESTLQLEVESSKFSLTKSEIVEMVIEQTLVDLTAKETLLAKEEHDLLTVDTAKAWLVAKVPLTLTLKQGYDNIVPLAITLSDLLTKEQLDRLDVVKQERQDIRDLMWKLRDRSRAKLEILKVLLDKTPEGANLLKMIQGSSKKFLDSLTTSVAKELTSG